MEGEKKEQKPYVSKDAMACTLSLYHTCPLRVWKYRSVSQAEETNKRKGKVRGGYKWLLDGDRDHEAKPDVTKVG